MSMNFNNTDLSRPKRDKTNWTKKPWFPFVVTTVLAMVIGTAIGASGQPKPVTKEVIKEVPGPERVVTKEVVKNVEVTPASCLKALDLSEQGFSYAAEAMGYMSEALTAAGNFNVTGLQKANADLSAVSPKLKELTTPMRTASAECRAGAV